MRKTFARNLPRTITEAHSRAPYTPDWKDRVLYLRRRYRASNHTHKAEVRERILERDGHRCTLCGSTTNLTIDHIVSVYDGGSDEDDNLQILCRSCNAGKTT